MHSYLRNMIFYGLNDCYIAAPMPVNHRPDLTSSMHVAAATGQPLMAPAPMGGPQLFYPPQGAIIPGTPQPYTQVRVRLMRRTFYFLVKLVTIAVVWGNFCSYTRCAL